MPDPNAAIEKCEGVTCITLGPEFENLDEKLLDAIRPGILEAAAQADPPWVLIDIPHTRFFGSSFIEILFRVWNRVNNVDGGRFGISGLTPYCTEVLQVTHLDKLWSLYDDRDAAVRDFTSDGNS